MILYHFARLLLCAACVASLSPLTRAGFITGQVVNQFGAPVPGINIDARNFSGGGGGVTLLNDGTDANGFFTTTIPAGTFIIQFLPPQPPATNALVTEVAPIAVTTTGTTAMGVVVLTAGVALSGRVTNPLAVGVTGINFDVIDASGNNVDLIYDQTDALGNFAFASPAGAITLRIDPSGVAGQTLAPLAIALNVASDTNLGTIQLQQGYLISALVRGPTAAAINGCDVDVIDPATKLKLYTPGDTSNSSGFVDFVIPAGTWWIDFYPPFALQLAAKRVVQTVSGTTSLGVQTLAAGWIMSGTLRDCQGVPVVSGNVDLKDNANPLLDLPLGGSGANGAGVYQVIVPRSVAFDVHFKGAAGVYAQDVHTNITAVSNFTLDGVLGPAFTEYCFGDGSGTACPCGHTGTANNGCPNGVSRVGGHLAASGRACIADDTLVLTSTLGLPFGPGLFFQGSAPISAGAAFGNGLVCATGTIRRLEIRVADATGKASTTVQIHVLGAISAGNLGCYQFWYRDDPLFCPNAGFNLTNALQVTWVP